MGSVLDAWTQTASQHRGLFATPASISRPDSQALDAVPSALHPGPWADLSSNDDTHGASDVVSHQIWLLFWLETWQVRVHMCACVRMPLRRSCARSKSIIIMLSSHGKQEMQLSR